MTLLASAPWNNTLHGQLQVSSRIRGISQAPREKFRNPLRSRHISQGSSTYRMTYVAEGPSLRIRPMNLSKGQDEMIPFQEMILLSGVIASSNIQGQDLRV